MATDEFTRRRRRKPGDLNSLRRTLWAGLLEIEDLLASDDPLLKLRAAHALATLAGSYMKCIELHDIAGRIERLESTLGDSDPTPIRRRAS